MKTKTEIENSETLPESPTSSPAKSSPTKSEKEQSNDSEDLPTNNEPLKLQSRSLTVSYPSKLTIQEKQDKLLQYGAIKAAETNQA